MRASLVVLAVFAAAAVSASCATGGTVDPGESSSDGSDSGGPAGGGANAGGAGAGAPGGASAGGDGFGGFGAAGGSGPGGSASGGAATGGAATGGLGTGGAGPDCGNGAIDAGEQCDGANLAGQTCATVLGQPSATGTLGCTAGCALDASTCAACGDGTLQGAEQCDDGNAATADGCESCQVVCVGNEVQLGLNCYADVTSGATRANAHSACSSSLGGHLVTIGSQAENDFVWLDVMTPATGTARWIDLSDQAQEGSFVWSTSEPVAYTNWGSGEPNNSGNEDCAEFRYFDNEWNDGACGSARPFICEYEPPVLNP
jgi:cysteine-rich repeat protein